MRAGAVTAIRRAAVLVRAAVLGAIAGVDADGAGAAHEIDEHVRRAGELKGAGDDQELGEVNQAPQPRRQARRPGRAAKR